MVHVTKFRGILSNDFEKMKFLYSRRIGDSPIPGAGGYVDNLVGGASATGNLSTEQGKMYGNKNFQGMEI